MEARPSAAATRTSLTIIRGRFATFVRVRVSFLLPDRDFLFFVKKMSGLLKKVPFNYITDQFRTMSKKL